MKIELYIHNNNGLELDLLKAIHKLLKMTKIDFDSLRAELNESITNIADDITRLTESLSSGLSEAEEATILAEFREVAARLKMVADRTANPENGSPA